MKQKIIGLLCISILAFSLIGCEPNKNAPLTVDVFAARSNYQGLQGGWYGKIIDDQFQLKLNIISPNVSGGGNVLFNSRLAANDVGELIIASYSNLQKCMEKDLLTDLTPYIQDTTYLSQYLDAIRAINGTFDTDGHIYMIPANMSLQEHDTPKLNANKPNIGSYMPWDYYAELGYPTITSFDDLLDTLEKMQQLHPYTKDGYPTYAFSLFSDWDVGSMSLVSNMARSFGFMDTTESIYTNADLTKEYSILSKNGIYYQLLSLYFEANQRGLVDPESGMQSYDDFAKKIQNKQILYLWWSWMASSYNPTETADGYAFIPVSNSPIICDGFQPYGDGYAFALSTDNKQIAKRLIAYLDWMASPEGVMCYANGPENLCYTYSDNLPVLTEFSNIGWNEGGIVPDEYGGESFLTGRCQINDSIVDIKDLNPETGESYHSENWSSTLTSFKSLTDQSWSNYYNADSPAEYLQRNGLLDVITSSSYIKKNESPELIQIRETCSSLLVDYSWKMIFAENRSQFNQYWEDLIFLLKHNHYDQLQEADRLILNEMRAASVQQ